MRSLHSFPNSSPRFCHPSECNMLFVSAEEWCETCFYPNLVDTARVFSEVKLVHHFTNQSRQKFLWKPLPTLFGIGRKNPVILIPLSISPVHLILIDSHWVPICSAFRFTCHGLRASPAGQMFLLLLCSFSLSPLSSVCLGGTFGPLA